MASFVPSRLFRFVTILTLDLFSVYDQALLKDLSPAMNSLDR